MTYNRPGIITAFCIIGFIGYVIVLIAIAIYYSYYAESFGEWVPPYLALSAIISLVCIIGLWMMKKWSIITYSVWLAINQIVVVLAWGVWNISALIINIIVVAIIFLKYEEME